MAMRKEKDYVQALAKIIYSVILIVFWLAVIFFVLGFLFALIGGTLSSDLWSFIIIITLLAFSAYLFYKKYNKKRK